MVLFFGPSTVEYFIYGQAKMAWVFSDNKLFSTVFLIAMKKISERHVLTANILAGGKAN